MTQEIATPIPKSTLTERIESELLDLVDANLEKFKPILERDKYNALHSIVYSQMLADYRNQVGLSFHKKYQKFFFSGGF